MEAVTDDTPATVAVTVKVIIKLAETVEVDATVAAIEWVSLVPAPVGYTKPGKPRVLCCPRRLFPTKYSRIT
jgi:hypothetical protein